MNGAHETKVLQDKLCIYIEKFVLCPQCKLPESAYKVKHEIIFHNCLACGAREPVDMTREVRARIPLGFKSVVSRRVSRLKWRIESALGLENNPHGPSSVVGTIALSRSRSLLFGFGQAQADHLHPQDAQD